MNLFYQPDAGKSLPLIRLIDQEAKHATRVMRMREGDRIEITDGAGNGYHCKIESVGKDELSARVIEAWTEEKLRPELTLLLGVIKKRDRLEFALEKCTELGISRITLFTGDHSEKQKVRLDRAESAVLSAMKQSQRLWLPDVTLAGSLDEALSESDSNSARIIMADEEEDRSGFPEFDPQEHLKLVIGPEGGFSKRERRMLAESGATPVSLGEKRLRAETAAMVITDRFRNVK